MMGCIWLMWCGRDAYVDMRREIKARCEASRFVRLSSMSDVKGAVDGFDDERLCAAVFVGRDVGDVGRVERVLSELSCTGRLLEIIACMHEVDAGVAARCFHAGATEVIAVGSAPSLELGGEDVCTEEESHNADLTSAEEFIALSTCDDIDEPDIDWEEIPPWDNGPYEVTDEEPEQAGRRAPVVTVVSGRGGVGKTTLVAAMAACAARAGLRAAVLDLDLMFGNLPEVLGVEGLRGIEGVGLHAGANGLAERDVESAAMRVGPGLTLWGPCAAPERAEFCAPSVEQLLALLRGVADVIFIDTSCFWGDAAAMAVASCDRCLVVGGTQTSAATSGRRVVELATRLGVPRTRMTCVYNRMGARGSGEEQALAFEMGTALRSRARIVDGGDDVAGMLSFGQMNGLIAGQGAFAQSVRTFTSSLLQELGCPIAQWLLDEEQRRSVEREAPRFRLPWRRKAGDLL